MKNSSGFTFVELMLSVVIFSVVLLSAMPYFSSGNESFFRAKKLMFATTFGSGIMEKYYTLGWDHIVYNKTTAIGPGETVFTCETTINTGMIGSMSAKFVNTTVTWPGQKNEVDFMTIISSITAG